MNMEKETKLNDRQEKFCLEYVKDFNASAAARRSGYSENTCAEIGYENLRKPQIKSKIAELLKEISMEPDEIKKRLTDIGRGDLGDYVITRMVPYTPKVKIGIREVIDRLKKEIQLEDDYAMQAALKKQELIAHEKGQQQRRRQIIRLSLELNNDPQANRIVNGETQLIERAELDIVAISRDKEKGKIKSFKETKDGIHVELYPADAALVSMAKVHALFIDKTETDIKKQFDGLTVDQLDMVSDFIIELMEKNGSNK
jgi:phage terminase small subunit